MTVKEDNHAYKVLCPGGCVFKQAEGSQCEKNINAILECRDAGAAYIAFLFFAMCAGFDSALGALSFCRRKKKN